jgi:hypothetical protein
MLGGIMASYPIYEFYAELDDFKPKIWRRFQVMSNITVARLGYVLQVLFEMEANHLMAIKIPRGENFYNYMKAYSPDMPSNLSLFDDRDVVYEYAFADIETGKLPEYYAGDDKVKDIATARLAHAIGNPGDKLSMDYDFGDSWCVNVTLEKVFKDEKLLGKDLPRVLDGKNFGIIEDVGGTWGLGEFVQAFKEKKGEEYEHFRSWSGKEYFDITEFDIDDMNFRLKKIPRIYMQAYELGYSPTKRSIDLIERNYLEE